MFKDPTNGKTTYKAGRYLDWDLPLMWAKTDAAELDFNFAFVPYCFYSHAYSCALATDRLSVELAAGERLPKP